MGTVFSVRSKAGLRHSETWGAPKIYCTVTLYEASHWVPLPISPGTPGSSYESEMAIIDTVFTVVDATFRNLHGYLSITQISPNLPPPPDCAVAWLDTGELRRKMEYSKALLKDQNIVIISP